MKIQVLKDSTGNIVASFERKASAGTHLEPHLEVGQKVEELEVPDNYVADLASVYRTATKR